MSLRLIFFALRVVVKTISFLESAEVALWRKQLAVSTRKGLKPVAGFSHSMASRSARGLIGSLERKIPTKSPEKAVGIAVVKPPANPRTPRKRRVDHASKS